MSANSNALEHSETQDSMPTNGNHFEEDSETQDATPTNSNDLEDSEIQAALTNDVTPWTAEQNIESMPRAAACCVEAPTVAILADYDGCWDVISETNPMGTEKAFKACGANYTFVKGILECAVASITHDKKVTLFMGSNRQSSRIDKVNKEKKPKWPRIEQQWRFRKVGRQVQDTRFVTEQGLAV